jgi:phosphoribosylformimino-5-aminoimidazole carboxamide ribonucleotide (ProFAR) isomerase
MEAVRSVARATTRRVIAAGGIRDRHEVDELDRDGIDAVVHGRLSRNPRLKGRV